MNIWDTLLLLILFGFPALSYLIYNRANAAWLSPVLLCYTVGILLANFSGLQFNQNLLEQVRDASILIGIPLLLFSTDLATFLRQAKSIITGFFLCILSGLLITLICSYLFNAYIDQIWIYSGMLVGVYTGGTPNMNLIGRALEAPEEAFIFLNGADIAIGGLFLLLLLAAGKNIYGFFLQTKNSGIDQQEWKLGVSGVWPGWSASAKSFGLAVLVTGLSVALTLLFTGKLENVALLLLILTTLSILCSFQPKIRGWQASYTLGEYALLIFSVAIGLMANFQEFKANGVTIILFTAAILFSAAFLHILLARLFKVDRDTTIITATAAFYGPPFVPQVASSLKNPSLIFPGIVCGLAGFAIGNYLGILFGTLLQHIMG